MEFIAELWLPIVLSAAAVWFWAFLSHAALRLHDGDRKKLADEQRFMETVTQQNIAPGLYSFPWMGAKECKDPAAQEKWRKGPLGMLHVWDGKAISMGRNMILTYLVYLVVSFFAAYVGHVELQHTGDFMQVFQVMGTIGILAYTFAAIPEKIWFNWPCRAICMDIVDGVVQGLATGLIFAALWPATAVAKALGT